MQVARNVQFQIKQGKQDDLRKLLNDELVPMLKKQEGFKSELAIVNDREANAISVWDSKAHADKYQTASYPKVMERIQPLIEGTPTVRTFDVAVSTHA